MTRKARLAVGVLLVGVGLGAILFLTSESGDPLAEGLEYEGKSIEVWFEEAQLRQFELDVINGKEPKVSAEHREAFVAMAPRAAQWLAGRMVKPATWEEKLFIMTKPPKKEGGWFWRARLVHNELARQFCGSEILHAIGTNAAPAVPFLIEEYLTRVEKDGRSARAIQIPVYRLIERRGMAPFLAAHLNDIERLWNATPQDRERLSMVLRWHGPNVNFMEEDVVASIENRNPTRIPYVRSLGLNLSTSESFGMALVDLLKDRSLNIKMVNTINIPGTRTTRVQPVLVGLRQASFSLSNLDRTVDITPEDWQQMFKWEDAVIRANLLRAISRLKVDVEKVGLSESLRSYLDANDELLRARALDVWLRNDLGQLDDAVWTQEWETGFKGSERLVFDLLLGGLRWQRDGEEESLCNAIAEADRYLKGESVEGWDFIGVQLELLEWLSRLGPDHPIAGPLLRERVESPIGFVEYRAKTTLNL